MMRIHKLTRSGFVILGVLAGGLVFTGAPALAAGLEAPEVTAATEVRAESATLDGVLSPKVVGEVESTYEFLYEEGSACAGGDKAPEPAGVAGGGEAEPVSVQVGALKADTEYSVCLRVESKDKTEAVTSPAVTFRTSLPPETPKTEAATLLTGTTATLNGVLNPVKAGEAGTYEFTYQPSKTKECAAGSVAPEPPSVGVALGDANEAVSVAVSGLEGSTEYAFCVVASNKAEPVESATGSPVTFKTPAATPVIPTEGASGMTPFDGVLEGQVNTEKQETSYYYEYSSEIAKVEGGEGTPIGAGSLPGTSETQTANPADIGADIGGVLIPDTTYYYRLVATNGTGTTNGETESFTTSAFVVPAISEEFPTAVGQSTASLSGIVNPEFQSVLRCEFVYTAGGAPLSAPCTTPDAEEMGEAGAGVGTTVDLTGLVANTTYHYKVLAENKIGVGESLEETFTTLPTPPAASTDGSAAVTTHSASVTGTVNPNNSGQAEQDNTRYYFEYGQDTSYGKRSFPEPEAIGEGTSPVAETNTLGGLIAGRTYHYRIVASNDNNGTPQLVYGQDEAFTTAGTPPTPPSNGSGEAPPQSTSSTSAAAVFPNLTGIVPVAFVKERGEAAPSEVKSLTRAQKLKKALKACKKARGARRAKCEKQARTRYGKATNKRGK